MPRDEVSRTAHVGMVGTNGLIVPSYMYLLPENLDVPTGLHCIVLSYQSLYFSYVFYVFFCNKDLSFMNLESLLSCSPAHDHYIGHELD